MSGNEIFLDTNILIYLLKGNKEITQLLQGREFVISFITELELLSFPAEEAEKEKILELLSECFIVDINREIKLKVPLTSNKQTQITRCYCLCHLNVFKCTSFNI